MVTNLRNNFAKLLSVEFKNNVNSVREDVINAYIREPIYNHCYAGGLPLIQAMAEYNKCSVADIEHFMFDPNNLGKSLVTKGYFGAKISYRYNPFGRGRFKGFIVLPRVYAGTPGSCAVIAVEVSIITEYPCIKKVIRSDNLTFTQSKQEFYQLPLPTGLHTMLVPSKPVVIRREFPSVIQNANQIAATFS